MCPLFYVWSCGIAKKKSVNFLTRNLVFCPHTIKNMRPKFFWNRISIVIRLFFHCQFHQKKINVSCYLIFQKICKYLVKSQNEIIQCKFTKVLASLFNIIRQKCAGCQVTYLPKIDALFCKKDFKPFE